MKRPIVQSVLICLAVTTGSAAADDSWQKDHDQQMQQLAAMPKLPPANIGDVLQFRIEQNDLVVRTRLSSTNGPSQIQLSDCPGLYSVEVNGPAGSSGPPDSLHVPIIFTFMRYDFEKNNGKESITTVMSTPMNLQVARDIETGSEIQNISVVQTNRAQRNGGPGITLHIGIQSVSGDRLPVNIVRSATDFVALQRQYPADTATYLEPIFRDLHADADVFGIDPKLAWQVFAAAAKPQPKVTADVQRIIVRLDSDYFHDRESAARELSQLGQPAALSLLHFDRTGLSAEQNSRLDAFLSPYHPVSDDDARRLGGDVNFLIDCLYLTDDFIVNSSLDRLKKITRQEIDFDPSLRDDARRDAIAKLRDRIAPHPPTTSATPAPANLAPSTN